MLARDCEKIVDKMTARVRTWCSRYFSFAGRLQLVNSVLMSMQVYWAQIFLIPKKRMKKVNSICKSYLWHGTTESLRPGYVAWDRVCSSKKEGGWGIRNEALWNTAAVGKYVWAVATKQENLWVKWVHSVYIKRLNWWD